jgi:putative hydrolase of the HAD superfamily
MLPWRQIDMVLLDMDGTLLDLRFDNHSCCKFSSDEYQTCYTIESTHLCLN